MKRRIWQNRGAYFYRRLMRISDNEMPNIFIFPVPVYYIHQRSLSSNMFFIYHVVGRRQLNWLRIGLLGSFPLHFKWFLPLLFKLKTWSCINKINLFLTNKNWIRITCVGSTELYLDIIKENYFSRILSSCIRQVYSRCESKINNSFHTTKHI